MTRNAVIGQTRPPLKSRFAALAVSALISGMGIAASTGNASADIFLDGQSSGMNKCVRAILGGYEVKKVKVHGHHFNCKPLRRWDSERRTLWLSHAQFGSDDQFVVTFRVNRSGALEIIQVNSAKTHIRRGKINLSRLRAHFRGPSNPASNRNYGYYANRARAIRPVKRDSWRTVARQIATIVIAQIGYDPTP
jgi:hypothetical protein